MTFYKNNSTKSALLGFDNLPVTTMTVVIELSGSVNLDVAFPLLEIKRLNIPPPKRQTQKYKIPFCDIPGSILSARYKGCTRGIIKGRGKKFFLNAITLDLSTSKKNVSVKLSKSKMQMCGITSIDLAKEAADYLISKLQKVQHNIQLMKSNPDTTKQIINRLKLETKGQETCLCIDNNLVKVHLIKIPEINSNSEINNFLLSQARDFATFEDYNAHLDWIMTVDYVIEEPLKILEINKVMVNFNYDLGFSINRFALSYLINGKNGFISRYDNTIDHSVTIELPCDIPEKLQKTRRKDKIPCHTFLVYRSGLVTQSGPGEELMKDVFDLFCTTIYSIRDQIQITKPN